MTSRRSEGCRNRILYAELQHTSLRKVGNVAYWLEEDRFCNLGLGTTEPSRWPVRPAMTVGGFRVKPGMDLSGKRLDAFIESFGPSFLPSFSLA